MDFILKNTFSRAENVNKKSIKNLKRHSMQKIDRTDTLELTHSHKHVLYGLYYTGENKFIYRYLDKDKNNRADLIIDKNKVN